MKSDDEESAVPGADRPDALSADALSSGDVAAAGDDVSEVGGDAAAVGGDVTSSDEVTDLSVAAAREVLVQTQEELLQEHTSQHELSVGGRTLVGVEATPGVAKPDPILVANNVSRRFGGLLAVNVDHLEVQRGTITALIGPNGAGKSTFFNLVSGFDKPTTGTWHFDGKDISHSSAHHIARLGMVRTFQLTKALTRMTALENMMLGATGQSGEHFLPSLFRPIWASQERAIKARADELLGRFNLSHMRDNFAGTMSGGQRKLLEMARAMMVEPDLLMLDEPMAGVNPALTQSLLGHIQKLRDEGTTIILVEHDMDVIMSISDWIVCFAEGAVIAEGRPNDIRANEAVIDAYLGARRALPASEQSQEVAGS